ncbi:hypothetical protein LTR78_005120 [Recurvomyces mirabilis]|uniref:Uncharacterized protein n=1 Tax=Recurvomyces mirabilis TaxID=574656 RepID=A0AAE0WNS0_9PEZI|nr:hypothetical protein LTR78_005120 [Recurvomyces mirabilis]KAK5158266.1 hypothetical protein LTS14_003284 [Recurvomyces mirabilis]
MSAAHVGSPAIGASGKKLKTKLTSKKASVTSFIGPPHLPKLQRQLSNGSRLQRLIRMHNTLVKYEKICAPFDTDTIALEATTEPKLIAAKMMLTTAVTYIALTGSSRLVLTRMIQVLNGKPLSRAKAQHCREAVAMFVIVPKNWRMQRTVPSTHAALKEPVIFTDWDVGVSKTLLTFAMQKLREGFASICNVENDHRASTHQNVITVMSPRIQLKNIAPTIALGRVSEASALCQSKSHINGRLIAIVSLRLYHISRIKSNAHAAANDSSDIVLLATTLPQIFMQVEVHYNIIAATIPCLRIFLKSFHSGYPGGRALDDSKAYVLRSATGLATKGSGAENDGRLCVNVTTSVELQRFNVRDMQRSKRGPSSDAASDASEMPLYDTVATTTICSPERSR